MRLPKPFRLAPSLLAGAALLVTSVAIAQPNPVQTRQDGLKRMQENMQAIQAAVRAGGDMRPMAPRADDIVAWFSTFPQHFPAGSDGPPSKALPTVWSDRAGFEQRASDAVTAARSLQVAVNTGDAGTVGPALQGMGNACGACHRAHRGR